MTQNQAKSTTFAAGISAVVLFDIAAYMVVLAARGSWSDYDIPPGTDQLGFLMFGVFVASVLLTTVCLFSCRRQIAAGGKAFFITLALATTLLFGTVAALKPIGSVDNFWNTLMSRGWTQYGRNPYLTTPIDLKTDPIFPRTAVEWGRTGMMYGPLWVLAAALPTLVLRDATAALLGMKSLVSAGYIAAGLLLFAFLRRRRNPQANLFLAAWLLNPAGIFEVANAGHNEGLLLLSLAIFAIGLIEKRPRLILPGLTAAILIKIWPACLLPAVLGIKGVRRKEWLYGAVISAVMTVVSFAFFWHGWEIFRPLLGRLNNLVPRCFSPGYYLLTYAAQKLAGGSMARTASAVRDAATVVMVVGVGLAGFLAARGRLSALAATKTIMMIFLFIFLSWLQPWYLLAILPFCLPSADEEGAATYLGLIAGLGYLSFASYIMSWMSLAATVAVSLILFLVAIYLSRILRSVRSKPPS